MAEERVPRRLAAILAADVVGYSRMMGRDEAGTLARLKSLRAEFLHPKVAEYGGRIVKTTGDGTLIEFGSAVDAVAHAVDVQRGMAERNASLPEGERIWLRLGINVGDIIIDGDDIYGDGVNVAARLEALAEPGGICISDRVHDYVGERLDITCEDLGPQAVKNIAEPVHVYRIRLGDSEATPTSHSQGPLSLPSKPSIAVLPLQNMSGDPEQEYFADGITEDVITALSRIRQFFVIARNSTFQYKGSSPDIRQVARELGVRYVLEGSVRKTGERVRISAQLIDGATGNHLWAERFDRKLNDVFAIQDEITQAIVGQIEPELDRAEYERVKGKAPENLDAWELFHRGMALVVTRTREDNLRARQLFERSLELDPEFASAYSGIAWSQTEDLYFGFETHDPKHVLDRARRAVALDDKNPFSHTVLAQALSFVRQPDLAIDEARRAIQINPSLALAHGILGRLLNLTGYCREGMTHAELAIRLSPSDPHKGQIVNVLATGNFYLGNYEKAVEYARTVIQTFDTWSPWLIITSALGHIGDRDGAAQARAEAERHQPRFSIDQVRNEFVVFHEPYLEQLLEGLRKAGVPEK